MEMSVLLTKFSIALGKVLIQGNNFLDGYVCVVRKCVSFYD